MQATAKDTRTAEDVARQAKAAKPHVRYAYHKDGASVAAWVEQEGRGWTPVAGKLLDGQWAVLPFEVLVNGERIHRQEDWREV